MASREAATFFFFNIYFFPLYKNSRENAGKQNKNREMWGKNVPTRHLKSHPAGGQETHLFLRVASRLVVVQNSLPVSLVDQQPTHQD